MGRVDTLGPGPPPGRPEPYVVSLAGGRHHIGTRVHPRQWRPGQYRAAESDTNTMIAAALDSGRPIDRDATNEWLIDLWRQAAMQGNHVLAEQYLWKYVAFNQTWSAERRARLIDKGAPAETNGG